MTELLAERVLDVAPAVVRRFFEREWIGEVPTMRGSLGRVSATKRVVMTAGTPTDTHDKVLISVSWRAARFPRMFPKMEALVELVPVAGGKTCVAFWGRYRPPAGRLGRAGDRVGRHIAESTVDALLDEIVRDCARSS